MVTPYTEGYEQGEWDTEHRLHDEMAELRAENQALREESRKLRESLNEALRLLIPAPQEQDR